ncbi:NAD-dependent epimerase/dehydratase family protein [Candidatus Uabimicrobium sp. HlEnr_7]|uniref:NAD-dependent epimerase/dehydratase family protein n=1 Tax=Candidatus Uabimicrobium helgolandensis TaxID=3095367 RepID=UPI00355616C2
MTRVLVTGAGGFIGHHLVKYLKAKKYWVRGIDIKQPEFESTQADEFEILDLREWKNCLKATENIQQIFHFAANMGGIGFIENNKADIVCDNTLIDMHMLKAAKENNAQKFLYTSSACIYPGYKQNTPDIAPLKEDDAYPADPEDGYGWEKLYIERACRHYREDYGLQTYVVRFHNIFGPLGTYDGGREKSPAAICRKIALAKSKDEIEVWGDGEQTRSYCYIDDCIIGIYKLLHSDYHLPLNLGQDRMITINQLVDIVAKIAEKTITKKYDLSKPQGVRGRNSDNTKLSAILNWSPEIELETGLEITYKWIREQLVKEKRI